MPRPRSLTPAAIATATLAVLDRDGLTGLTMRAVAKELGMATMSLYRYINDRDELEALVVDHVLAEVDLDLPPDTEWASGLAILLGRMRAGVGAHPATVPLLLRHRHSAPASLRCIEAMLTVLTEAGFAGRSRVLAQRTLVAFLWGTLQNEHFGPLAGTGTAVMAALPVDAFPLLAATAADARKVSADEEFDRGLDIVLRGLSEELADRSGARA